MYKFETPILVVEQQESHRQLLVSTLRAIGYKNIMSAEDIQSAWQTLKSTMGIEIVISEWTGTSGEGLDLVFKIREDEALKDLGFILMSNEGEHDQVLLAIKAGVDLYVKKPFASKTIEQKLKELFKIRNPKTLKKNH